MSLIYYSLTDTFGPQLILAQIYSQGIWSNPLLLSSFLESLTALDFGDYDSRKVALSSIIKLQLPQLFYTYSFDPLQYPLAPPFVQTRFPSSGTFVYIGSDLWQAQLQLLSSALSYRDTDGPISGPQTVFIAALASLTSLYNSATQFYDRATFELTLVILWSLYPPP